MNACPQPDGSGCMCPAHHPGLTAFTVSPEHHAALQAALEPLAEPVHLRVVTMPTRKPDPCDGTYTCRCTRCIGNIQAATPVGAGPAAFTVRPPRHRRAA